MRFQTKMGHMHKSHGQDLENTLQYNTDDDETQNKQSFPQQAEKLEPTPEVGDHYIGA